MPDALAERMDTVTLRELASVHDAEMAATLLGLAHRVAGTWSERFAPARLRPILRSAAESRGGERPLFFIAGCRRRPVLGVVGVAPAFCSGAGWELGYLAVSPEWQGKGIGRVLVEQAVAAVRGRRPRPAFVLLRAGNPEFFTAAGFRALEIGAPALMRLDL